MRGFCLEVSGPLACFTRPEMKVERVSYDVITPSAARAIFSAIFWKPAIYWCVKRIDVLAPVNWISVRRSEVSRVMSERSNGLCADEDRQQRAGLLLRDVCYRLYAEFVFIPPDKRPMVRNPVPEWLCDSDEQAILNEQPVRKDETEAKYAAIFERRAKKGQYFHHPYLGCREFAADVRLIENPDKEPRKAIDDSRDLGWMLYDMDYTDLNNIKPMFYRPRMNKGIIMVPDMSDREEVRE